MGKLVGNEQRKLTATYFNGLSIALMAVGVLAPVASILNGAESGAADLVPLVFGCVLMSSGLHYLARQILAGLVE